MEYYNGNEKLSVIHFANNLSASQLLFEEETTRPIKLDPEITILTNCNANAILYKQCLFNRIKACILDMKNILQTLNRLQTKYVLLVLGDAMILNGLSELKKFDFLMCGNNEPNSKYFPINNNYELMLSGTNKYPNPNLIFARRTKMIEFFEDFFEYCNRNLGIANPYNSKNVDVLFNLWYSTAFNKYMIDSNILKMTSLTRSNYNVQEKKNDKDELVRFVEPNNFHEKEFRLF